MQRKESKQKETQEHTHEVGGGGLGWMGRGREGTGEGGEETDSEVGLNARGPLEMPWTHGMVGLPTGPLVGFPTASSRCTFADSVFISISISDSQVEISCTVRAPSYRIATERRAWEEAFSIDEKRRPSRSRIQYDVRACIPVRRAPDRQCG